MRENILPMGTEIKTIAELVGALGGTCKLADLMRLRPAAVSMWMARGEIPRGYHLRLSVEIWKRGLMVSPSVFELEGEDARQFETFMRGRPMISLAI